MLAELFLRRKNAALLNSLAGASGYDVYVMSRMKTCMLPACVSSQWPLLWNLFRPYRRGMLLASWLLKTVDIKNYWHFCPILGMWWFERYSVGNCGCVCFLRHVASFVKSLSTNTLSFHRRPCLALRSLWGMREIDTLGQRALSFSWAVSNKYRAAKALEEEQFLFLFSVQKSTSTSYYADFSFVYQMICFS